MQAIESSAAPNIIYENGSLNQFYLLTDILSKTRYVRFISKNDDADNIEWNFKYHGRRITLQYSIYNGISLFPENSNDTETMNKLLNKIKAKAA